MEISQLTEMILRCAYTVHTALGPGLLESAYEECLYYELKLAGFKVEKQKALPLIYKEVKLDAGYRIDLLVKTRCSSGVTKVYSASNVILSGHPSAMGIAPEISVRKYFMLPLISDAVLYKLLSVGGSGP